MPIAPLVAAWGDRWPVAVPGPFGTDAIGGVPFRAPNLLAQYPNARLIAEAAFGADLTAAPQTWNWYDITGDVRQADGQLIAISPMGRSDEASTAQPAGCTFQLDNSSAAYSAYNANSLRWPFVRRNTPIRVTVNLTGFHADDSIRFQGYANGWVPSWDGSARLAVVTVSASGITRRLQQGKKSFSPLRQYVTDTVTPNFGAVKAAPVAYWSLEDGGSALEATSAVIGVPSLTVLGATPGFSGMPSVPGSLPICSFKTGTGLTAPISVPGGDGSVVRVHFLLDMPDMPAAETVVLRVDTPSAAIVRWEATLVPVLPQHAFYMKGYDGAGNEVLAFSPGANAVVGEKCWISFELGQSGSTISYGVNNTQWRIDPNTGTTTIGVLLQNGTTTGTLGNLTQITIAPNLDLNGVGVGHLAIYTQAPYPSVFGSTAVMGYAGENAVSRLRRLCTAEGVTLDLVGTSDTLMGPQLIDTFLANARDVEQADQGVLLDGRGPGFTFIARSARYNQAATLTVDAAQGQIPARSFEPADDDQRNRNLIEATRRGGGSSTYEDETGPLGTDAIGAYDSSVTVNIHREVDLLSYASWLVRQGTVEGFRYPSLAIDLAGTAPELAADWAVLRPAARVDVTNVSTRATQHPPGTVSLIAEGWGEQLSPFIWSAGLNCSPYSPWSVGVLEQSGFLDCGACILNEDLDTTETGIDVLITDRCVWDHGDGDFVIVIDGEEMTVTAVTAAVGSFPLRTQTLTVTRSVNGVVQAHGLGAEVHVRDAFIMAL